MHFDSNNRIIAFIRCYFLIDHFFIQQRRTCASSDTKVELQLLSLWIETDSIFSLSDSRISLLITKKGSVFALRYVETQLDIKNKSLSLSGQT